jgi:hypothetical protein
MEIKTKRFPMPTEQQATMVTRWRGTMLSKTISSKWEKGMGTKCSTTSAIGLPIYIWWIEWKL